MIVSEIIKIPASEYEGKQSTLLPDNQKNNLERLPGRSGYFYLADKSSSVKIVTPDRNRIVAELKLDQYIFPLPNTVQVDTISVDQNYKGQGLGLALYGVVLTIMKKTLVSGDIQTPGGRRMWAILWNLQQTIPNLRVRGYFSISDYSMDDDRDIPVIVGKLGAEYLGTINHYHMFAFDVNPTQTGKELEATIKTKFSKIYGNEFYVNSVGLFARIE